MKKNKILKIINLKFPNNIKIRKYSYQFSNGINSLCHSLTHISTYRGHFWEFMSDGFQPSFSDLARKHGNLLGTICTQPIFHWTVLRRYTHVTYFLNIQKYTKNSYLFEPEKKFDWLCSWWPELASADSSGLLYAD